MTATKPEYLYMAYSTLWKRHTPKEQLIMGRDRCKFSYPARHIYCASPFGPSEIVNITRNTGFQNPFQNLQKLS